ncbi:MAG: propanediol utilization protein [Clostridiales bacterium]|nr:MAG: propanediol utilization protein [Clostridiales bacterium]
MSNKVVVETSARHVHLTAEQVETLFGKGHKLTVKKMLSQPGQFACEEKVDVVGPKNTIRNVSVLGPERKAAQVEVSLTDARTLGIAAPVRESGDIADTPGVKLVGPAGELTLAQGVIAAKRHIHLTPDEAAAFGLADKEIVTVRLDTARPLIFDDVVVRVRSDFAAAMHIDTDESNAACAFGEVYGEIRKK